MRLSYERKKGLYGYGFIALWFIGALFFFIIPVFESLYYSFFSVTPETGYLAITKLTDSSGAVNYFLNYRNAFLRDAYFSTYLVSVLRDMLINTPIIIIFSLFVAIVINQEFRGKTFARAVFFLPVIIATGPVYSIITGDLSTTGAAEADQFSSMFSSDMVDELLEFVGIYGISDTLTETISTLTSDILNLIWKCGIQIIIFLSALQGIPASAKEAAAIEGATSWEFFWKITIAYISPMLLVNLIYTIIDTFADPTNLVMERIIQQQDDWLYGYAAAMAWSYFLIVLVVIGIVFALMNKVVYYDD
ncbi:MAG: sugar ABC transporter permease [Oscillospiraceae bacterium]|nr:sugar ABC transporter permease [Oscillospiraceae bacterium]